MNNHEHRTEQTYESYTFQPVMSFWGYPAGAFAKERRWALLKKTEILKQALTFLFSAFLPFRFSPPSTQAIQMVAS